MQWEKAGGDGSSKRPRGKVRGFLIGVFVIVAVLVLVNMMSCGSDKPESIDWPKSELAAMLPEPKFPKGEIWTDSDEEFHVRLEEMEDSERTEYIEKCKEIGFKVEPKSDTHEYIAFNDDGYKLDLSFIGDGELDITLKAPLEMSKIAWPTSGPGSQVPTPSSLKGKVTVDRDDCFIVSIGGVNKAAFAAYTTQCRDAGFNVDFNMGDELFTGKNAGGYSLRITYEGNNIIEINASAPMEPVAEEPPAQDSTADAPTADTPSAGATEDTSFRAWVDEYEKFMNEYVDFMVEYQNSGNAVGMALDYANWIKRYGEMSAKAAEVDESQLSEEDALYYLNAQNRINQRLLEIG